MIDASIPLRAQGLQMESPSNQLMKVLQLQGAMDARRMNQMQFEDAQRNRERANRLQEILASGGDETALMKGGFLTEARTLVESKAKASREQREAEKAALSATGERIKLIGQVAGSAKDPQSWAIARQNLARNGFDVSNLPEQFDPQVIGQLQAQALDAAQQLEQVWKQKNFDLDVRKANETERNNQTQNRIAQGTLAVAQGNLGVNRERLNLERGQGGKAPPGYRFKEDGSLEAIPGGPADLKAGAEGAKAERRKAATEWAAGNVLTAVKEARALTGRLSTGISGQLLSNIGGTDARDLQAKIDTIKGNLGFDRLQEMRDNSPTGGALGQVAVQELTALQSTVASLDQAQSRQQLNAALDKIERHYTRWLETTGAKPPSDPGGSGDLSPEEEAERQRLRKQLGGGR